MKNTNKNKTTKKLPVPGKVKKGFRLYCAAVLALAFTLCCSVTAFAAGDPDMYPIFWTQSVELNN